MIERVLLGNKYRLHKANISTKYIDTLIKYTCDAPDILPNPASFVSNEVTINDMIIEQVDNEDGTYTITLAKAVDMLKKADLIFTAKEGGNILMFPESFLIISKIKSLILYIHASLKIH